MAVVAGEVTTDCYVDLEDIIRKVIVDIGYNGSEVGFDGESCAVLNAIGKQSPDINQGVDRAKPEDQGAGDQGLMFGYATDEWDKKTLHPYSHVLASQLCETMTRKRKSGEIPWLRPDCKSQVIVEYEKRHRGKIKPVRVDNILIST